MISILLMSGWTYPRRFSHIFAEFKEPHDASPSSNSLFSSILAIASSSHWLLWNAALPSSSLFLLEESFAKAMSHRTNCVAMQARLAGAGIRSAAPRVSLHPRLPRDTVKAPRQVTDVGTAQSSVEGSFECCLTFWCPSRAAHINTRPRRIIGDLAQWAGSAFSTFVTRERNSCAFSSF